MDSLKDFFTKGLMSKIRVKNNGGFSHNGPYVITSATTLLERWHVNDFSTVEYTISADLNTKNKEIVKVLVTATADDAHVIEFARNSTGIRIIEIEAFVNNSYVDILVTPSISKTTGAKVLFTGNYFENQNPLRNN